MKKYVFESLKFFCAAILCTILSAFTTPALADLDPCRNLLDPEWTQNKGTNGSNGNVVDSEGWSITDLIPVEPGQYVWSMSALYQTYTFYYDTNKQFISPHGGPKDTQERQITIPSNAKYVRLQIKAVGDSLSSMQQQLERGDTATEYTPYNPQCATCDGTVVNYTSATGTVSQSGTPTPENPIEPVFFRQGDMILRAVGDYKDAFDATTGKITRRVGVKVFDGTEDWGEINNNRGYFIRGGVIEANYTNVSGICTHYKFNVWHDNTQSMPVNTFGFNKNGSSGLTNGNITFRPDLAIYDTVEKWQQFLATQAAAGTPVTMWYPLAEETTEDWTESSYCYSPIKIATTKYNETKFSPLNTALQNAISVVDSVVSNTITQAASIATLQAQKQTRPNDIADDNEKCPAGKKCLLVEDASGVPHWYEIVENAWDLPVGYTQLQYIESTGTQYIDTGYIPNSNTRWELDNEYTETPPTKYFYNGLYQNEDGYQPARFDIALGVNGMYLNYGASNIVNSNKSSFINTRYMYVVDVKNNKWAYNDTTGSFPSYSDMVTITKPLYLFARNDASGADRFSKQRTYSSKIYDDGILVRDFVPAKNPGGVVGMYDTVSGTFFTNQGTGEFIAGDPVSE